MTYHQRFASTLCAALADAAALGGRIVSARAWNLAIRYTVEVRG